MNLFAKAKIYQTKAIANAALDEEFKTQVIIALGRFFNRDWGDLCEEDIQLNEEAMKYNDLVHGAYDTAKGRIWVIAESQSGSVISLAICVISERLHNLIASGTVGNQ